MHKHLVEAAMPPTHKPLFRSLLSKALISSLITATVLAGCGGGGGGTDDPASTNNADSLSINRLRRVESSVSPMALTQLQAVNLGALSAGTLIEDFDSYSAADGSGIPNWVYIPGAEFSGAAGSLALNTRNSSRIARLEADLGCSTPTIVRSPSPGCGKYVGASRTLTSPMAVSAPNVARVQLRLKLSQPLLTPTLRLIDEGGQTLQYNLASDTLESAAGAAWATVSVAVKNPSNWWGGQNNGQLQTGIKGLSVNASQWTLVGPRTDMQVDDIRLMPDNFVDLALTGQEPLLQQSSPAPTDSRLSVNARYYKISDTSARLAAEAGFSTVRVDLFWETVEKNGKFDFSVFDAVLKRLAQQGLKALFILDYGHPDHGVGAPVTEEQRNAFVEYAKQATRFAAGRNVVGFEVWNEPDSTKYWVNGDPQTYAQLLNAARTAIKSIDPTRLVTNGGPSWFDFNYILSLANTGSLAQVDAFAIHGYRGKSNSPEGFAPDLRRLQHLLQSKGLNQPVWTTEWGTSSAGLNTTAYGTGHDARARNWQARVVLRKVLTQLALNVPFINLYELVDSGTAATDEEDNYGLLTSTLSAKPAYTAIKQLTTLIKGKTYNGLLSETPSTVHGMKWTGGGASVYAVWTDSDAVSARLTVPSNAQLVSWDGTVLSGNMVSSSTKQITLTTEVGPVYVVF